MLIHKLIKSAQDASWISTHNRMSRSRSGDDRTGPYNGIWSDFDARKDDRGVANKGMIMNGHACDLGDSNEFLHTGVVSNHPDIRSERAIVSDRNQKTMGRIKKHSIHNMSMTSDSKPFRKKSIHISLSPLTAKPRQHMTHNIALSCFSDQPLKP